MCGRFTLTKDPKELEARFKAKFDYDFEPRYNAAPVQKMPVITSDKPDVVTGFMWGLVPKWLESGEIINVRMETLRDKHSFAADLSKRRCLIPADGFYEWKKEGSKKIPYRIVQKDEEAFAFAGIWEESPSPFGGTVNTFAVVTCEPNSLIGKIHNRMPVILPKDREGDWLKNSSKDFLINLMKPFDEQKLLAYEVNMAVNNPVNDSAHVIERVD